MIEENAAMNMLRAGMEPLIGFELFTGVLILICGALVFSLLREGTVSIPRIICAAVFLLALSNPVMKQEKRQPAGDVAAVIVDTSRSQLIGSRIKRTETARTALTEKLRAIEGLEIRITEAGGQDETHLFGALDRLMSDVPPTRRAGIILLSDGQIHDRPDNGSLQDYGPFHLLLTGEKDETDRSLTIIAAPAYGIAGQNAIIKFRVNHAGNLPGGPVPVTVHGGSGPPRLVQAVPGQEHEITVPVEHAGQNVFQLSVAEARREISAHNNTAAVLIQGVREKLRVLLVSGQPHAGGRSWRDVLTADPGVDLVHFTILREPEKLDATPQDELSLIAFPFEELFEKKLYDFDLIIFDRYKTNRILPDYYFDNIARFVEEGGAFLAAAGPEFSATDSIFYTELMRILPGSPTGDVISKPYRPEVSPRGLQHPVTHNLGRESQRGRWLRQVGLEAMRGDVLMTGANGMPLLILDHFGKGRVAQIASDQLWLWPRGYDDGGPYHELLRRVVHWLMKEPDLDEKALNVSLSGDVISVTAPNFGQEKLNVTMTEPDGAEQQLSLEGTADESLSASIKAEQPGLYGFSREGGKQRFIIAGADRSLEMRDVLSTADIMATVIKASGGSTLWLSETPAPDVRMLSNRSYYGGGGNMGRWIGLRRNDAYDVTGLITRPLFPFWVWGIIILAALVLTWWHEGLSGSRVTRPVI